MQILLDDIEKFSAERNAAVLVALSAHMQDTAAVVASADVADVGVNELVGP